MAGGWQNGMHRGSIETARHRGSTILAFWRQIRGGNLLSPPPLALLLIAPLRRRDGSFKWPLHARNRGICLGCTVGVNQEKVSTWESSVERNIAELTRYRDGIEAFPTKLARSTISVKDLKAV